MSFISIMYNICHLKEPVEYIYTGDNIATVLQSNNLINMFVLMIDKCNNLTSSYIEMSSQRCIRFVAMTLLFNIL